MQPEIGDRLTVPYRGGDDRHGPATWGQLRHVYDNRRVLTGRVLPLERTIRLAHRSSVADVIRAIGNLVAAYEGLRTVLTDDGHDGIGQLVPSVASIPVDVRRFRETSDVVDWCRSVRSATPIDQAEQFVRPLTSFELAVSAGRVEAIRMSVPHAFADRSAMRLLVDRLANGVQGVPTPAPGQQPLERAVLESTSQFRERSGAAIDHWRRAAGSRPDARVSRGPAQLDAGVRQPGDDLFQLRAASEYSLVLPDAAAWTAHFTDTTGVSATTLLAFAAGSSIARALALPGVLLRVEIANRFSPTDSIYVGCLVQPAALWVDTEGELHDQLRRTEERLLRACRHARYDPTDFQRQLPHLATGGDPSLPQVYFNDKRVAKAPPNGRSGKTYAQPRVLPAHDPDVYMDAYLTVASDVDGIRVTVRSVDSILPPARTQAVILHIATVLEAAARGRPTPPEELAARWDATRAGVLAGNGPWN